MGMVKCREPILVSKLMTTNSSSIIYYGLFLSMPPHHFSHFTYRSVSFWVPYSFPQVIFVVVYSYSNALTFSLHL